ncbi:Lrp/AsnC family transcriptional regulator [Rhizobium sp. BR 315]|uniref:Lrp/AsnC family transcriptional regulator n=1 Tax=Rhizobium sp. BR 315 TaxID=3040014 RepID=UPI003D3377CF
MLDARDSHDCIDGEQPSALDALDRVILALLAKGGRMPANEIAIHLRLSAVAMHRRCKRLMRVGHIVGFRAIISRERVAGVKEYSPVGSDFDYLLKDRARELISYRRALSKILLDPAHVSRISSLLALKEPGAG